MSLITSLQTHYSILPLSRISLSCSRAHFGTRRSPNKHRKRVEIAVSRRVKRLVDAEVKKRHAASANVGKEILSQPGTNWGLFFALGVFPLIGFSVAVGSTPELRAQFEALTMTTVTGKLDKGDESSRAKSNI